MRTRPAPDPDAGRPLRAVRALRRALPPLACIVGALGVALELSVRDAIPVLAILHYATPPLVVAPVALAAALLARRVGRHRWAAATVLVAAAAAVLVATNCWCHGTRPSTDQGAATQRVVFWNACRAKLGTDALARRLAATHADALFLVEARPDVREDQAVLDAALASALPEHRLLRGAHGIAALVRGPARVGEGHRLADGGAAVRFELELGGRPLQVVVADIDSNPLHGRGAAIDALRALVAPLASSRALVVGDFNTPRRSVHFDAWRATWRHAFETAGTGLDGTWPAWFPALALDHVWASGDVDLVCCTTYATASSDHRLVEVELR